MLHIPGAWITISQPITRDDGTTDVNALTAVCLAFKDGRVGHRDVIMIVNGRRLFPNLRQLYPFIFPARNLILMRKESADNLGLAPPCCADATKGTNQPSRPSAQLPPAPVAMINTKLRSEYDRAQAAGKKPLNIKEVSRPVQLAVEQEGHWASIRQIQKLAEADEFKARRLPLGKRWSSRKN
jgi:hypothetical protein